MSVAVLCRSPAQLRPKPQQSPATGGALVVLVARFWRCRSVERLRTWASGRCLDADRGGIYSRQTEKAATRRKVARNPLNN